MKNILVAVLMVISLFGCGTSNTPSPSSPAKSVESFLRLLEKGESRTAEKFLTARMKQNSLIAIAGILIKETGIKELKVQEESIQGDIGRVDAFLVMKKDNSEGHMKFDVVLKDGVWLIDGVAKTR